MKTETMNTNQGEKEYQLTITETEFIQLKEFVDTFAEISASNDLQSKQYWLNSVLTKCIKESSKNNDDKLTEIYFETMGFTTETMLLLAEHREISFKIGDKLDAIKKAEDAGSNG